MKQSFSVVIGLVWAIMASGCSTSGSDPGPSTPPAPKGIASTFAGSGLAGAVNANGTNASFNNPLDVAMDEVGNLYVSDYSNNMVRKISPSGDVGTLASIDLPTGIAVDAEGYVYVASSLISIIYKISPGGEVETFAGGGGWGSSDGTGTNAYFGLPQGLAFDQEGNLYVADSGNQLIRKITPSAEVTTLAGTGSLGSVNGTGISASFYWPSDLAFDGSGNLYVVDGGNNLIRKIMPSGEVSTFAGSGKEKHQDGQGIFASFNSPSCIAIDTSGNMYVSDYNDNYIRLISTSGRVSTYAGSGEEGASNGLGFTASFNRPRGLVTDQTGNLYVADAGNHMIRKLVRK